jgi:ATP-binding cassette, subfamily C (CFTR/MRP), member 1
MLLPFICLRSVYARSMNLTHRSRAQLPNGRLMTLISSDVTRVQTMVEQAMLVFTSPLQVIVCLILLIIIMGPAGLAGFVVFAIAYPPFRAILGSLKTFRVKAVRWTERRVALISEVLASMQLVKFFTFEV